MQEKRELLLRLCKLAFMTSFLNMIVYVAIGYRSAIFICVYGAVFAAIVHVAVQKNLWSQRISANLFCFTTFVFFFFFILTSGKMNSPILPWLTMIPLVSFQLFSFRNGALWTGANLLFLSLLYAAPSWFSIFQNELEQQYSSLIAFISNTSLILFVITFSLIYKSVKEKMLREIATLTEQQASLHYWIKGQEDERKRIASDLHDGLAQQVVALRFKFYSALSKNKQVNYTAIDQELNEVIAEIKHITNDLHPKNLELFGLQRAVEMLLEDISEHTILQCTAAIDLEERSFPAEFSIQVYRIVQECLQNAIKHSGAATFSLHMIGTKENLQLRIVDSGVGISEEQMQTGIFHLRERVNYLKGTLTVQVLPQGTTIEIIVPV